MTARAASLLLLLTLTIACGASQRTKVLRTQYTGLSAASDGLVAYDKAKKAEILASATSEADGIAKFETYKATRDRVVALLVTAYRALAAAAVVDGSDTALVKAISASSLAIQAWASLKEAK